MSGHVRGYCTAAIILATALVASADTIRVPGDQPNIQAGIDAARNGDEVLVADGVYTGSQNRNINFFGKLITVRSENGPQACTVDCQKLGRGFIFETGETRDALLQGFTISNGVTNRELGAGIYCPSANPTIRDCVITNNDTDIFNGAGVFLGPNTSALLDHCLISDNRGGGGAGIFCEGSLSTIRDCVIARNVAGVGGGTLCTGGQPTFINCLFFQNHAPASLGGGAVFCNAGSTARFINCTMVLNTADGDGGAIYSNRSSAPILTGCILWDNQPDQIFLSGSSGTPAVSFSNVQGSWPGASNIDADPIFANPAGDDFRLAAGSPCIDAGDNTAVPPGVTTDLAGNPRFVDDPSTPDCQQSPGQCGVAPVVDMGAYEFQGDCDPCDMNCDGLINALDIETFIGLLFNGDQPCGPCTGDTNGDGAIDALDIEPFLNCLFP